jgi:hypothetical protein
VNSVNNIDPLFLLYFLYNLILSSILGVGYVAGVPRNRKNAVTPVLSAVTLVTIFLALGLINLYLGLVALLVLPFERALKCMDRVFIRILTPVRSVAYIVCLMVLEVILAYLATREMGWAVVILLFHSLYIALALYSFKMPTLEDE